MIHTWIADITPLYLEKRYRAVYDRLPEFRKEKAAKLRLMEKKAQSAGAWALLEQIRKKYNISDTAAFNLSHSKEYALCSVDMDGGASFFGCDIEKVGDVTMSAAKRFFCPSEYEAVLKLKEEKDRSEAACRIWVLKESFMKAVRKGMALGTQNIEVQLGAPSVILKKPGEFNGKFYFQEYEISGIPYKMAVCAAQNDIVLELHTELNDYFSKAGNER